MNPSVLQCHFSKILKIPFPNLIIFTIIYNNPNMCSLFFLSVFTHYAIDPSNYVGTIHNYILFILIDKR